MNNTADMNEYFSAMSNSKPYKTYIKTILGRVYVTVLSLMTGSPTPEGVILEGDPRKKDQNSMFDVWSEHEDYFFKKMNKRHFDQGILIEYKRVETPRERTIEEFSDDELKILINKPFLALQATLNKTKSVATLFRIKNLATDLDKSEKVIRAIDSRISEVQEDSVPKIPSVIEEEL